MVGAPGRRRQVEYAKKRGLSKRRACALVGTARSGLGYESARDKADAPVIARMRELATQYPRYGYRRIRIFLARDGFKMSVDRAHRLWKKARLQVPKKRPRRRIATGRPRPTPPTTRNHVCSFGSCPGSGPARPDASGIRTSAARSRCTPKHMATRGLRNSLRAARHRRSDRQYPRPYQRVPPVGTAVP